MATKYAAKPIKGGSMIFNSFLILKKSQEPRIKSQDKKLTLDS